MTAQLLTPSAAVQLTSVIKGEWDHGAPPDACVALDRHPELLHEKSAVIDLAFTEFYLRQQAGEQIDPRAFAARFPAYGTSIRNVLLADQHIGKHLDQLEAPWPEPGESVDVFHIVRELGRGAFARVYLAREGSTGDRPVALKLSRNSSEEAQTLGRLPHPGVVPILSARHDPESGFHVVCMPYLGSATLLDVLDVAFGKSASGLPRSGSVVTQAVRRTSRPGDPEPDMELAGLDLDQVDYVGAVLRVGVQLAKALDYLHRKHVYHRDLKPSNVLLTPGGAPLLLDFNLSVKDETAGGRIGGTLPYMAPEQIRAFLASGPVAPPEGAPVDLFALGVVLYELLTGTHPFGPIPPGAAPHVLGPALLECQARGFKPIRALNPDIDPERARLLESCLALDPSLRPASAEALARGLCPAPCPAIAASPSKTDRLLQAGSGPSRQGAWFSLKKAAVLLAAPALGLGLVYSLAGPVGTAPEPKGPPEKIGDDQTSKVGIPPVDAPLPAPIPPPVVPEQELIKLDQGRLLRAGGNEAEARKVFQDVNTALGRLVKENDKVRGWGAPWLAYYGQGRALVLLGEPALAQLRFVDAKKAWSKQVIAQAVAVVGQGAGATWGSCSSTLLPSTHDGKIQANRAYCYGLLGNQEAATLEGERALAAGYRNAAVLNNLAYSYMQSKKRLEDAAALLGEAERREPNAQLAVITNRCRLAILEKVRAPASPLPEGAVAEIDSAMAQLRAEGIPTAASLYFLAAQIHAARITDIDTLRAGLANRKGTEARLESLAKEKADRLWSASEYLESARTRGITVKALTDDPILQKPLADLLDSSRLMPIPAQPIDKPVVVELIDPIPHESF